MAKFRQPKYRKHSTANKAFVEVGGKRQYLAGAYNSIESLLDYDRIVKELHLKHTGQLPDHSVFEQPERVSVNELLLAYMLHAEKYYRDRSAPPGPDGTYPPSEELANMKNAVRRLKEFYGNESLAALNSSAFEAIQLSMIQEGLARGYINSTLYRIRRVFRWGVKKDLVKPELLLKLECVDSLREGRSDAREPEPKEPVADEWVEAVLPFLSPQVAAMVKLQRLTGMRSDEVCRMRACDIDRGGEVWLYELGRHKTSHKGKRRVIPLGPQAQLILRPFITGLGDKFLFSPADVQAQRLAAQRAARKSKVQPSQQSRKKRAPKRKPGERYTTGTYRNAVQRGIKKANEQREKENRGRKLKLQAIPKWHPYQLRHAHSTTVRRQFGEEAAQVSLGHARMDTTAIYGEKNLQLAMHVAREIG